MSFDGLLRSLETFHNRRKQEDGGLLNLGSENVHNCDNLTRCANDSKSNQLALAPCGKYSVLMQWVCPITPVQQGRSASSADHVLISDQGIELRKLLSICDGKFGAFYSPASGA